MAAVPIGQYTTYNALLNALLPTTQSGQAIGDSITNNYNDTVSDVATLNALSLTISNPLLAGMG
jgi:hypothetical protein